MRRFITMLAAALMLAAPHGAMAGSSQAGNPILPADAVAAFADRVQRDLAARGARVVIVARVGRDPALLPQGVIYTHVAYWVFSDIRQADGKTGKGYRVYNLYQLPNEGSRSALVQDSPADFFAGAFRLDAGIIIPDPKLQDKLLRVIDSPTYARLHNPAYAVLANPRTSQFQNCTEHALDVLFASLYDTSDIPQIKANISAYFTPQPIPLDGLKRGLATVAAAALTTADHGANVGTATFGSLSRFMSANKLASAVYRITPDQIVGF